MKQVAKKSAETREVAIVGSKPNPREQQDEASTSKVEMGATHKKRGKAPTRVLESK